MSVSAASGFGRGLDPGREIVVAVVIDPVVALVELAERHLLAVLFYFPVVERVFALNVSPELRILDVVNVDREDALS